MFMRGIAVFVAAVVLMTGAPVMAQSSDLLTSATRGVALMTQDVEQEQTFVRRRRSGRLAWTGGILVGVGAILALRPPACGPDNLEGDSPSRSGDPRYWSVSYRAILLRGECTLASDATGTLDGTVVSRWTTYQSDGPIGDFPGIDFGRRVAETDRTWNQIGWATAAAGGVLLGIGLSGVDVPVRLDVAPGGFSVAHSRGW